MKPARRLILFRVAVITAAAAIGGFHARTASLRDAGEILLFSVVLVLSDLLSVTLPRGGEVSAAVGTTVTVALLFPQGTAVAMVAGAGLATLALRLVLEPRRLSGLLLAERVLALALAGPILSLGKPTGLGVPSVNLVSLKGLTALVFVVVFCAIYAFLDQAQLAAARASTLRAAPMALASTVGPVYLALGALGLLAAVVYPSLGVWSLLLITGLLLVVRQSFNLYSGIRSNYQETIRALAEAIEAQDPATRGHAERTAALAVQLGRELGLHGQALETLSYAALLHDIGKLAMPPDSLDSLLDSLPAEQDSEVFHAERGAEILGQVEYLRSTAELVRYHHHPVGSVGRRGDPIPIGARVIAVASAYDLMTHLDPSRESLEPTDALRKIRMEPPGVYDPRVVRSLEKLLSREGFGVERLSSRRLAEDVE